MAFTISLSFAVAFWLIFLFFSLFFGLASDSFSEFSELLWQFFYYFKSDLGSIGYTAFAMCAITVGLRALWQTTTRLLKSGSDIGAVDRAGDTEPPILNLKLIGLSWLISAVFSAFHLWWIAALAGQIPQEWILDITSPPAGLTSAQTFAGLFIFDAAFSYFAIVCMTVIAVSGFAQMRRDSQAGLAPRE